VVSTTVTAPVPSWMPPSGVLVSVSGAPVPRTVSSAGRCGSDDQEYSSVPVSSSGTEVKVKGELVRYAVRGAAFAGNVHQASVNAGL
jgi:hypothetical protein